MKFIYGKVDEQGIITNKLENSEEIIIAVFCFSPSREVMEVLLKVPKVTLMYAQEYDVTDPEILNELKKRNDLTTNQPTVLFVPKSDAGRLHAKIYYGVMRNNEGEYAFVGSANMTQNGFLGNQEAGILLESKNAVRERSVIRQVRDYLVQLKNENNHHVFGRLEYERAISAHKSGGHKREQQKQRSKKEPKCWLMIAEQGSPYWQQFLKYHVVGHGFSNPVKYNKSFQRFNEMHKGDLVLIHKGFSQSLIDVPVFGFVRIKNDMLRNWKDDKSRLTSLVIKNKRDKDFIGWLRYWRETSDVMKVGPNFKVPREMIGELKGSANRTCLETDYHKFAWFLEEVEKMLSNRK
jgi:HKD family nuclease